MPSGLQPAPYSLPTERITPFECRYQTHDPICAPHVLQNFTPAFEYFPQLEQRTEVGMGWFTITCVGTGSFVTAQMKATIQPATVQPSKRFSQKIALEFLFLRPTIVGRKYRR